MRIFTGYYPNTGLMLEGNMLASISRSRPAFWEDLPIIEELAPPAYLLNLRNDGLVTDRQFSVVYAAEVLGKFSSAQNLVAMLYARFGNQKPLGLICWETPDAFCHRHLVADFLRMAGLTVPEWEKPVHNPITDSPFFRRKV